MQCVDGGRADGVLNCPGRALKGKCKFFQQDAELLAFGFSVETRPTAPPPPRANDNKNNNNNKTFIPLHMHITPHLLFPTPNTRAAYMRASQIPSQVENKSCRLRLIPMMIQIDKIFLP
jgi:hypothetical protein